MSVAIDQGGKVNDPYVSYSAWQNIVRWMLNLQAHGKGCERTCLVPSQRHFLSLSLSFSVRSVTDLGSESLMV